MNEYLLIPAVAFFASLLTFFSGFGLGTLLTPVFMLFFPLEISVAMTGIVHLLNNLFKLSLVYPNINKNIVLRFGLPAVVGSFLGAYLLISIPESIILHTYQIGLKTYNITVLKLILGIVILFFAFMELLPTLQRLSFSKEHLVMGGLLSGFFGGLSGHQGALRTAFLLQWKLPKEVFIATGVAIACLIDLVRLSVYASDFFRQEIIRNHYWLIIITSFAAFIGAYFGNRLLKKITMQSIQIVVAIFLILIALCLILGIL